VTCCFDGKILDVEVLDAGPGFRPSEKSPTAGLGLAGLRDRIESIGGELKINCEPGQGTCLAMHCGIDGDERRYVEQDFE
jgi:signal transduction histidine kinase